MRAARQAAAAATADATAPARHGAAWFYLGLGLLFALHHDFWFWDRPRLVLGLPAGLLYHVLYCVAAAGLMAFAVRRAWPPPGLGDGG